MIWVSPSGHTFVTIPGSAYLFPGLCAPTAVAAPKKRDDASQGDRSAKMPQRRRTRVQNHAAAVAQERAHNCAMRQRQRHDTYAFLVSNASPNPDDEPPPF